MTRFTTEADGHSTLVMGNFAISYQPHENIDVPDGDQGETALMHRHRKPTFLILKGDWRKDYEQIVDQGYEACVEFYESKKAEFRSKWSEDVPLKEISSDEIIGILGSVAKGISH